MGVRATTIQETLRANQSLRLTTMHTDTMILEGTQQEHDRVPLTQSQFMPPTGNTSQERLPLCVNVESPVLLYRTSRLQ